MSQDLTKDREIEVIKFCKSCKQTKPLTQFYMIRNRSTGHLVPNGICKICTNQKSKEWTQRNRQKSNQRTKNWVKRNPEKRKRIDRKASLRFYGMTLEQYATMLQEQHTLCAICLGPPNGKPAKYGPLCVDHYVNLSGVMKVRRLLCNRCNMGLGYFKDKPEILRAAGIYIETYGGPNV